MWNKIVVYYSWVIWLQMSETWPELGYAKGNFIKSVLGSSAKKGSIKERELMNCMIGRDTIVWSDSRTSIGRSRDFTLPGHCYHLSSLHHFAP